MCIFQTIHSIIFKLAHINFVATDVLLARTALIFDSQARSAAIINIITKTANEASENAHNNTRELKDMESNLQKPMSMPMAYVKGMMFMSIYT